MIISTKRKQAYRSCCTNPLGLAGRIRRVSMGVKDYQSGVISQFYQSYAFTAFEQKTSTRHDLAEVNSGQRRFLVALSGRAFTTDQTWAESAWVELYTRPLSTDRLWLEKEGKELLILSPPAVLDAGLGVFFEVLVQ